MIRSRWKCRRSGRGIATLAFVTACAMMQVPGALACACCVSAGARQEGTHALHANLREEIDQLVFADYAWLHTTEAFPDDIKGIVAPQSGRYAAAWARTKTGWTLTLTAKTGAKGTLALTLPPRIERRESHIPERPENGKASAEEDQVYDQQRDVRLHKEWHLVGPVRGDGMFAPGMKGPPAARLILQGTGNGCAMANDFYFWTLIVKGPSAAYTLLGRILPEGADAPRK